MTFLRQELTMFAFAAGCRRLRSGLMSFARSLLPVDFCGPLPPGVEAYMHTWPRDSRGLV